MTDISLNSNFTHRIGSESLSKTLQKSFQIFFEHVNALPLDSLEKNPIWAFQADHLDIFERFIENLSVRSTQEDFENSENLATITQIASKIDTEELIAYLELDINLNYKSQIEKNIEGSQNNKNPEKTSTASLNDIINVRPLLETEISDNSPENLTEEQNSLLNLILERIRDEMPRQHPDHNIQILWQLISLEKSISCELESVSAENFEIMSQIANKFEKNVIQFFHLVTQPLALIKIIENWESVFRNKFVYKIEEMVRDEKASTDPSLIIALLVRMQRMNILDIQIAQEYKTLFRDSKMLSSLSSRDQVRLLEISVHYPSLEIDEDSLKAFLKSESINSQDSLIIPDVLNLYISLRQYVIEDSLLEVEAQLEKYLNQSCSKQRNWGTESDHLQVLERLVVMLQSHNISPVLFGQRYKIPIDLLFETLAKNGVSSEFVLEGVKNDFLLFSSCDLGFDVNDLKVR